MTQTRSGLQLGNMLSASLEEQLQQTKKLVKEAEEDEEAKNEAVEKVLALKDTLQKLKDQVLDEAENSKQSKQKESANKITNWVKQIAQKVPVISKLEKKLGMLQGLDPVLEGIVADLDKVTDFSSMIELQKKSGAFDEDSLFNEPADVSSESTEDLISNIKKQLESASKSSSEAKVAKKAAVEAEQMEDLEKKYSDKEAKKKAIDQEKQEDKESKKKAIDQEKSEEKSKIDVESDEKVKEA